jgi:dTDP-glucose pyrophosphorylase
MLNIVVPMAGRGSRFAQAGFTLPKPLIPVHQTVPMIRLVIENLRPAGVDHRFIFLCLQEHLDEYGVGQTLTDWAGPNTEIVPVRAVTEGAACTVLLAKEFIDNDDPMMIANSDQWVDVSINDYLASMEAVGADGLIMTMWADHPKWSYVRLDQDDKITEVVEKQVVSNEATVGIYNYRHGKDFVNAAEAMIAQDLRVNGEFYVAPAYNTMIADGKKLAYYNVGKEYDGMYGLGIPDDLAKFEAMPVSRKALATVPEMSAFKQGPTFGDGGSPASA